jgi:NADPH:quinone reductase-like Zn-dependent oxidoreductase
MMRAIVQHAYGTSDVLRLQDIDEPSPGPHDVLVGVHAASVNHGDWFLTSGRPYAMRAALGLRKPRVAVRGRDLAGQVEAVGAYVTRFRPGDDVNAETTTGSFAELACVPEDLLALKPANLTFQQAAAVPVAAVTALQRAARRGDVRRRSHARRGRRSRACAGTLRCPVPRVQRPASRGIAQGGSPSCAVVATRGSRAPLRVRGARQRWREARRHAA